MTLAQTPPMGWNSWDCYGTTATEDRFVAAFNTCAADLVRTIPLGDLGVGAIAPAGAPREAWSGDGATLGLKDGLPALEVKLPAHGAKIYRFPGH